MTPPNGDSPIDKLNAAMKLMMESQAKNWEDHQRIWKAIGQLGEAQNRTDAQIAALTASQKDANERVDKLVSAIGELISRLPETQRKPS
jgi:hypothetical protein